MILPKIKIYAVTLALTGMFAGVDPVQLAPTAEPVSVSSILREIGVSTAHAAEPRPPTPRDDKKVVGTVCRSKERRCRSRAADNCVAKVLDAHDRGVRGRRLNSLAGRCRYLGVQECTRARERCTERY